MKTLIVGGGVAGLTIGWRLAAGGCQVEVLERGLAGRGSSWAAAGMLAATAESEMRDDNYARLAHAGRAAWPKFAAELQKVSKIPLGYRVCGALLVAQSERRAGELKSTAGELSARGQNVAWRSQEEIVGLEPLLSPKIKGALYAPEDAQVDNRRLSIALTRAFKAAGGTLREHCDVRALKVKHGAVTGVATADGHIPADKVVIAAGAWSSKIDGIDEGVLPPVRPAKGQMTAIAPPDGMAMPNRLIWGEEIVYLVPRSESLLIGATVEDVGFETSVSHQTLKELIARASQLVPSLSSWRVVESWAGLRPRTPDDSPVLGETAIAGLVVASGQYRNGILFAPVLADMIRSLLLGEDPGPLFRCFSPERFAKNRLAS
jgi:glycine oxidase